jgi:hypothetical protein
LQQKIKEGLFEMALETFSDICAKKKHLLAWGTLGS